MLDGMGASVFDESKLCPSGTSGSESRRLVVDSEQQGKSILLHSPYTTLQRCERYVCCMIKTWHFGLSQKLA